MNPSNALNNMESVSDSYLDIDLDGLQLIEASAGTGKTFTLATLVTRLVVERGLTLGQILAVTFTEAATQELRARLRKRLALAAGISKRLMAGNTFNTEDDPEAALTLHILERRLASEDAASLHARLRRAEHEIDLASVFTIHGFCARVLSEHALQTGQAFDAPEMIGSERELLDEVAADVKKWGADEILLLPLYPQFSTTTTWSSWGAWKKAARKAAIQKKISVAAAAASRVISPEGRGRSGRSRRSSA